MNLIEGMRAFAAVVDAGSFTAGAEQLGISNKVASKHVAQLEDHIGMRLLHRTTRTLSLSDAGASYYDGCKAILVDLETLEFGLHETEAELRGRLRIAAPITFGEIEIVPLVAAFSREYPSLTIDLQLNDRYIDMVNEGFDVGIRIGNLADSGLVVRRLSKTEIWTVASPIYLKKFGVPKVPEDLKAHICLHDSNFRSGQIWPFRMDGHRRSVSVQSTIAINSARSIRDLAVAGGGIALCPSYVVAEAIEKKTLRRVLAQYDTHHLDVFSVYPSTRNLPHKVRVWVSFAKEWFSHLSPK